MVPTLITVVVVQARIDSHMKVLIARRSDKRAKAYHDALSTGAEYIRDIKVCVGVPPAVRTP